MLPRHVICSFYSIQATPHIFIPQHLVANDRGRPANCQSLAVLCLQAVIAGDADLIRVLGKHQIFFRTMSRALKTPWDLASDIKVAVAAHSGMVQGPWAFLLAKSLTCGHRIRFHTPMHFVIEYHARSGLNLNKDAAILCVQVACLTRLTWSWQHAQLWSCDAGNYFVAINFRCHCSAPCQYQVKIASSRYAESLQLLQTLLCLKRLSHDFLLQDMVTRNKIIQALDAHEPEGGKATALVKKPVHAEVCPSPFSPMAMASHHSDHLSRKLASTSAYTNVAAINLEHEH